MEKSEKIFIAGHRGLVGSALVRKLQHDGLANLVTRDRAQLDLRNEADVDRFFAEQRPALVIFAAAKVGGIKANNDLPVEFLLDNLQIQNNVIRAAHEAGVRKLLFLGSSCIYPKHAPQPIPETALLTGPLEPTNEAYAIAKIAGIKLCQSYAREYGENFISAMPTNLYGPNDNFDLLSSHVLPALLRKAHNAKKKGDDKLVVWGSGKPRREFLHVDDLAAACLFLLEKYDSTEIINVGCGEDISIRELVVWGSGKPRREFLHADDLAAACVFLLEKYDSAEIINVGCGEDISIRELAELICDVVGFQGDLTWDTTKPDGTPRKLLDVSKLHDLGWRHTIGLREGIAWTYEWFLQNAAQETPK